MKKIKVLGPGCPKCVKLYEQTKAAVEEISLECELEKVSDIMEITGYGVMMTPALVVDDIVKVYGKVPSKEEIIKLISD